MHRADDLAAELHGTAVVDPQLLDAAADAFTRLEHDHVGSAGREVACRGEPGEPGAEDEDVGQPAELAANAREQERPRLLPVDQPR